MYEMEFDTSYIVRCESWKIGKLKIENLIELTLKK